MSRVAWYLYAIARAGAAEVAGLEGVEEGQGVAVVGCGDLDALVSIVPLDEYESAGEQERPADPDWVIPRALRHERVVAEVAARSAALPARFGTVFSSEEAVAALVARHRQRIVEFLGEVEGKDEWSLIGYTEPERIAERLLETEPSLCDRFKQLPANPGARYFAEKTLRGESRTLAKRAARTATRQMRDLLSGVTTTRDLPTRKPEAPGREMVIHLACLLPREDAGNTIELVRAMTSQGDTPLIDLRITGPWPPFNFCPELVSSPEAT
jgi:hypothetical protein